VPITAWGKAVRLVLGKAGLAESDVADKSGKPRMTVNRYVRGERRPHPKFVLRVNRITAELVAGNGAILGNVSIARYLDVEAALAGLLDAESFDPAGPLNLRTVVDGACIVLETLGAGILRLDWLERLKEGVGAGTVPQPSRLLIELNALHGRQLLAAIDGRVPSAKGYDALRDVLTKYALSHLLEDDAQPANALEQLTSEIRGTLTTIAGPDATATQRFDAERKLLRSAMTFAQQHRQRRPGAYALALTNMMAALDESKSKRRRRKGTK
jgi:transcriptional regulator with XRE-family HTH domain